MSRVSIYYLKYICKVEYICDIYKGEGMNEMGMRTQKMDDDRDDKDDRDDRDDQAPSE